MKNKVRSCLLAAALATAAICGGTAKGETVYVTAENGLRVRTKPGTGEDCKVVQVLPYGAEVVVTGDQKSGWYKLEGGNYIASEFTSQADPLDNLEHLGTWRITAYAYTGSPCANGQYPTTGYTIACNSLPFGTKVYIEGVGFRTVEDRGPGWLGSEWCDLYLGDTAECIQWGNQYHDVYLAKTD